MKNKVKIIFIIIIIMAIFTPCLIILNTKADTEVIAEKGDLRCPQILDKNVTCTPKYDSNGKVSSVELVYEDSEVVLKKIVTKKSTLGKYDVEFKVKGKTQDQIKTPLPAYVMVVIDMSKTIKNKITPMKNAVLKFGETLIPNNDGSSNFYLGLIQFATASKVVRNFTNTNFNDINFIGYNKGGLGVKSHVEKAYKSAYNLFQNVPSNAQKYLFIFGDGRYWSSADTGTSSIVKNANKLKNDGVTILGARYKGSVTSSNLGQYNQAIRLGCKAGKTYGYCDEVVMKKIVSTYYPPSSDWDALFQQIAGDIKGLVGEETLSYYADLEDEVGRDFDLTDDESRLKSFNVGELTTTEKTFGPFEIGINSDVEDGWHETNENVNFLYYTEGNAEHKITITENPEVFWNNGQNLNIYSCSGEVTHDTDEVDRKDSYKYYSKICSEGYTDSNGKYVEGYKVRINVDDAKDGQKSFGLVNGRGFPTSVKLSTNIKCTYTFDANAYNKDYDVLEKSINDYNNDLNDPNIPADDTALNALKEANKDNSNFKVPTTTKSEIRKKLAQLEIDLEDLKQSLETYKNLVNTDDLKDYKNRFEDQKAYVKVTYENGSDDTLYLVNFQVADESIKMSSKAKVSVRGSNTPISPSTTATLHLEKEMGLPETCLDMTDATQEVCSLNSNQLSGGNKFYVDLSEASGSVSVFVPDAGYHNSYDFQLDKDENGDPACRFNNSIDRLDFRQIELDDPFLKQIEPNRGIGKNYLNDNFSFEAVIHDDIWNTKYEPAYYYLMSKTNISNIKKNTSEDYHGSYLGKNCYFDDNNKWRCHFTRNENDDGTDNGENWFTKVGIN